MRRAPAARERNTRSAAAGTSDVHRIHIISGAERMNGSDYTVKGFRAAAAAAGLKKNGELDLGLIVGDKPVAAAGVFTMNKVRAAPVILTERRIAGGRALAVLANAGCANACTGARGMEDAEETTRLVADELNGRPEEILVASTGVIGALLPMDKIRKALPGLVSSLGPDGISDFARAVMTTDSFPKISRFDGDIQGTPYRIVGVAKGAGMIMPNMATMLGFVLTDLAVLPEILKQTVGRAADGTFNRITVDGDTSTNDTLLALASGAAGNGEPSREDLSLIEEGLFRVMDELAVMMVRDGEGASLVIHVRVRGAATAEDAHRAARTVANSSLVKTAFCGRDANWGRILAALGRSGVAMREEAVDIQIEGVLIVRNGLSLGPEAEKEASSVMRKSKEIDLIIHLGQGDFEDRVVTCDLTKEYIDINANYRT